MAAILSQTSLNFLSLMRRLFHLSDMSGFFSQISNFYNESKHSGGSKKIETEIRRNWIFVPTRVEGVENPLQDPCRKVPVYTRVSFTYPPVDRTPSLAKWNTTQHSTDWWRQTRSKTRFKQSKDCSFDETRVPLFLLAGARSTLCIVPSLLIVFIEQFSVAADWSPCDLTHAFKWGSCYHSN